MTTVRTHLLVCAGTGCVSCGAFGIRRDLEAEIRRRGLGGEVEVPTMDGRVMLKIPRETQNGKVFRLKGKGLPQHGAHGGRNIQIPT